MTEDTDGSTADETVREPSPPRTGHRGWEIVIVVLLGLTAVATAWSGYQASLWDGIQSSNYTQASGARTNAAQQRIAGNQFRIADLGEFENYIDAAIGGDVEIAEFYRERFRKSLRSLSKRGTRLIHWRIRRHLPPRWGCPNTSSQQTKPPTNLKHAPMICSPMGRRRTRTQTCTH